MYRVQQHKPYCTACSVYHAAWRRKILILCGLIPVIANSVGSPHTVQAVWVYDPVRRLPGSLQCCLSRKNELRLPQPGTAGAKSRTRQSNRSLLILSEVRIACISSEPQFRHHSAKRADFSFTWHVLRIAFSTSRFGDVSILFSWITIAFLIVLQVKIPGRCSSVARNIVTVIIIISL